MALTKEQLLNDLEYLKDTSGRDLKQIVVDKKQVMEFLQPFEGLDPDKIEELKKKIEGQQEVTFESFKKIVNEVINIIKNKEEWEIAQLSDAQEEEINQVIASFKEQLNFLRESIEVSNIAPTQMTESSPQNSVDKSLEDLKSLFNQQKNAIKEKRLFGLFKVDWALNGFEELVLKEAKGEELSWWERIKKWGYALILGLVAGDLVKKTNETLQLIKDPIEAIKNEFGPEALEQYKEKLGEAFLNYLKPVIPISLSSQQVEEKWQKVWESMWSKYDRILVESFPQDGDLSKLSVNNLLTLGGMFAFDLAISLFEHGLISLKQLGFELVKEGGSYAFHMSIKGAQMMGGVVAIGLGRITLEDWRRLISMEGESAKAKAVWLYRLMETWIGEILKFGAKLPGYALSSMASLDDIAAKFKVFVDMWKSEGGFVLNQLEELVKLSGEGGEDFKKFKDLIKQVQESVAVYNAAKFAKTQGQFEENLRRFLPPEEVGKVMERIGKSGGDDFFKKVGNYLIGEAEKIRNIDSVVRETLLEKAGMRWKSSDLRKSIRYLGEVVEESGRVIIAKESVWGRFTNVFRRTEVAGKSMIVVDAKALSESSRDLRGALKLAMKQSPYLLSEFLGASPVFLLAGLELQECQGSNEGCSPERLLGAGLDVIMDLIPIVGPIRFLWGNKKEVDNVQEYIYQYAAGFGWLGLDTRYLVRNRGKKGLPKAAIDALLEPVRAVGNVGRFASRSVTVGWDVLKAVGRDIKNLEFVKFRRSLSGVWEFVKSPRMRGGWIGVGIAAVFAGLEAYKWWENKQKAERFKNMAESIKKECENSERDCEQYLRQMFVEGEGDETEKMLITSVLVYQNFGVGPQGMEIKMEGGSLKIVFNGNYNLANSGNPFVSREVSSDDGGKVYELTSLARQIRDYVEFLWGKEVVVKVKGNNIKPFDPGNNNITEVASTQTFS